MESGSVTWVFPAGWLVEIMKIQASPRLEEDTLAWGPGKYGIFSVKSAYQYAFEEAHMFYNKSNYASWTF